MAKIEQEPGAALALGMLADLLRRSPDAPAPLTEAEVRAAKARADAIVEASAVYEALRRRSRAAQLQGNASARTLALHNGERAEALLRRGKLQQRMDALRQGQAQAATPELGRLLRRQRAELAVEAEELDGMLSRHEAAVTAARDTLLAAQKSQAEAFERGGKAGQVLQGLQRQAAPLAAAFAGLHDRLGKAACRLYLACEAAPASLSPAAFAAAATWQAQVVQAAEQLTRLHHDMAAGRYAKDEVDPWMGGRATATGELLCALVALGEDATARALFVAACPPGQFFHQMAPVFRAYSLGLCLHEDWTPLAEAVRLHRYADGAHGALAQSLWALLQNDADGFAPSLAVLARQDWRTWSHTQTPAMGLVSTTTCALARLGHKRGLLLPAQLGPTVPAAVWQRGSA